MIVCTFSNIGTFKCIDFFDQASNWMSKEEFLLSTATLGNQEKLSFCLSSAQTTKTWCSFYIDFNKVVFEDY